MTMIVLLSCMGPNQGPGHGKRIEPTNTQNNTTKVVSWPLQPPLSPFFLLSD